MVTISPQCVLHRKMKEFIGTLSTRTRKARTKLQLSEDRSVHAACIPYFLGKHWFLNTWFLQPNTPDRNMYKSDNTCNKNWHTFKESSSWITIHGTTKTGLATPSHKKTSINSNTFQRITCKLLWLIKVGEVESLSMKMLQFWDLKFSN